MRCPQRTSRVPGAERWLLLAPGGSAAFGPCVLLLPSALGPQNPPAVPTAGSGSQQWAQAPALWQPPRSRSAAALLPRSPGCRPQSAAMQAGQGRREEGGRCCRSPGRPPGHRHPVGLGQADPSWGCCGCKGDDLPLRTLLPRGTPQPRPDLISGCKPKAWRGRAGSWLSPEISILTSAFSFAPSSAREEGRHLSPSSLTSEPEHPQGPRSTQEAPAAAPPQFISH